VLRPGPADPSCCTGCILTTIHLRMGSHCRLLAPENPYLEVAGARPGLFHQAMTTPAPDTRHELSPAEDLQVAVTTMGSFQTSIQHADAKATILLTVEIGLLAISANDRAPVGHTGLFQRILLVVCAVCAVAGLTGSLWHLGSCVWPRLGGSAETNRFGFAVFPQNAVARASAEAQRDEAWRFARELAAIALAKHRAVRRSMPWIGIMIVSTLIWIATLGTGM
jgi:hypothetical protein